MDLSTQKQKRKEKIALLPFFYSPILHFLIPLVSFSYIIYYLLSFYIFNWFHIPIFLFFIFLMNVFEWCIHKYSFHQRLPILSYLYDKHTKNHHVLFTHENMQISDRREMAYILMPIPTLTIFVAMLIGFGNLLKYLISPQIAILFSISSILYVMFYEITHLFYHLPSNIFGSGLLHRYLSIVHRIHHNPRHMNKYNFNVTFPWMDKIAKTFRNEY